MKMRPEQFTMWLRGVFDGYGEGNALPPDVAKKVYEQLSEVVAGQVANRLAEAWRDEYKPVDPAQYPTMPAHNVWGSGGGTGVNPIGEYAPGSVIPCDSSLRPVGTYTLTPSNVALQIAEMECQTKLEIAKLKAA